MYILWVSWMKPPLNCWIHFASLHCSRRAKATSWIYVSNLVRTSAKPAWCCANRAPRVFFATNSLWVYNHTFAYDANPCLNLHPNFYFCNKLLSLSKITRCCVAGGCEHGRRKNTGDTALKIYAIVTPVHHQHVLETMLSIYTNFMPDFDDSFCFFQPPAFYSFTLCIFLQLLFLTGFAFRVSFPFEASGPHFWIEELNDPTTATLPKTRSNYRLFWLYTLTFFLPQTPPVNFYTEHGLSESSTTSFLYWIRLIRIKLPCSF